MDLWSLTGGLSLARMRPILEVAGTSRLAEIDDIVAGCSGPAVPGGAEKIASLRSWRSEIGALEDSSDPSYFQSTAAGVAILVASQELPSGDREWRIRSSVGNFWDSCDDLLQAGGGYSRAEFQGIKTTLRGVEDIWREGDFRLLSEEGVDVAELYAERLSKIRSSYPKRRQIARVVAECAEWNIPTISP
ncbi:MULTISPECIES: hypothetical protein [Streptomyces]|uniref:Uncharacterized protein n=1 Tax=Streptomyces bacillaris TaxID=68179 RepID=A0ABW6DWW7_9ACTN|nr:hypothetical protein [Streptomyces nanshensis]